MKQGTPKFFNELYQFQTEPDLGYESGNESNTKIINEQKTNSETEADGDT